MGPPPPPLLLLLLLLLPPPLPRALPAAPAPARPGRLPGRLGCLFEDSLCTPSEACVNDGVFGRCQKLPVLDVHRDEVPPGALQHLRGTLQTLSRTGLTWQDDYTQHVTAQELTDVPSVRPQRPDASTPARTPKLNVENERRRHPENSVALAETLQRYLPSLGALSLTSSAGTHPRTRHGEALAKKNDAYK